jgi:hypothetical protein
MPRPERNKLAAQEIRSVFEQTFSTGNGEANPCREGLGMSTNRACLSRNDLGRRWGYVAAADAIIRYH